LWLAILIADAGLVLGAGLSRGLLLGERHTGD
jgi:hypothetical protein